MEIKDISCICCYKIKVVRSRFYLSVKRGNNIEMRASVSESPSWHTLKMMNINNMKNRKQIPIW